MSKSKIESTLVIYRCPSDKGIPRAIFGPFLSVSEALRWIKFKRDIHNWGLDFTVVQMISPDFFEEMMLETS